MLVAFTSIHEDTKLLWSGRNQDDDGHVQGQQSASLFTKILNTRQVLARKFIKPTDTL